MGGGLHVVNGSLKYDMAALLSGVLVLVASYDRDYLMRPGAIKAVLEWVGSRSYAMYLVHMPAFYLVREAFYVSGLVFANPLLMMVAYLSLAVILIILMSETSYRFVEIYWQRRGQEVVSRLSANDTGMRMV